MVGSADRAFNSRFKGRGAAVHRLLERVGGGLAGPPRPTLRYGGGFYAACAWMLAGANASSNCSMLTGFTRCWSKPASSTRRWSSARP